MPWDEQGNLRCGNEELYGCEHMKDRGGKSFTDLYARRKGWRIWQDQANCPECSKPSRRMRISGSIDQDVLPGFDAIPVVGKKSRKTVHDHS